MIGFGRTAARLAWRDLRFSSTRVALVILAVAAGGATVTAVLSLDAEMRSKLHGNAREWIAADIAVRLHEPPAPEELDALAPMLQQGMEQTMVTETYGMVASASAPDAILCYVKVVDPDHYPFFGAIRLNSGMTLVETLKGDTVVVSPDVLDRLHLRVGGSLRLGKSEFRVAASIATEPDWSAGVSTALPRILMSAETFEHAGLARLNDNRSYRLLFRLPGSQGSAASSVTAARSQLERIFPSAEVLDYRDPDPAAAASFEAAATFLQLAAALVLVAGSAALLLLIYLHMQRRLDSIAVMKALGGQSQRILAIYAVQICGLGLAGGIASALIGPLLTKGFAALANLYLPLGLAGQWEWSRALESGAFGLLAALPAILIPILRIREARPAMVLRRHTANLSARWSPAIRLPHAFPATSRLAARNLFRPGHHSFVIIAMLTGSTAILTATYICQRRVGETIQQAIPARGANLYLIGLEKNHLDEAIRWAAQQTEVEAPPQVFPFAWLRLASVNGMNPSGIREQWLVTCSSSVAPGTALLPGTGVDGIKIGDELAFAGKTRPLTGRVSGTRTDDLDDIISAITLPCRELENVPLFYHAAIRVRPDREDAFRHALSARFPSLPTLSRHEFTAFVQRAADRAVGMVQLMCWAIFAIVLALQASLVGAVQRLRTGESAIMRALGARSGFLVQMSCFEYGFLGLIATLLGIAGSTGLSSMLLSVILRRWAFAFDLPTVSVSFLVAPLLTALVGAVAGIRSRRLTPLEVLRDE
jgi:predicted lysophospholipase L1 biosynthesis ABC-type transport system permease subunit